MIVSRPPAPGHPVNTPEKVGVLADMLGRRFGRLVVVAEAGRDRWGQARWRCRCECGGETTVRGHALRTGHITGCGCGRGNPRHRQSGIHRSKTYEVWLQMLARCTNPRNRAWSHYGGRGITVCERWRSFENFLADMGERPPGLSIDRVDNERGYEPGNCRWATRREQSANRRTSRFLTVRGERVCLAEWARRSGLAPSTIASRLKLGWPAEQAVTAAPDLRRREHRGIA